eukprot:SAG31_NODE_1556_length_7893_cov_1.993585_7_plen_180_part_00
MTTTMTTKSRGGQVCSVVPRQRALTTLKCVCAHRILQQAAERAALERRWAPLQTAEIATSAATAREQLKTDSSAVHARASPAVCWDLDDDAEDDVDIELRQWLRTRSLLHLVDYVALLATSMEELVEVTPDEISVSRKPTLIGYLLNPCLAVVPPPHLFASSSCAVEKLLPWNPSLSFP